MYRIVYTLARNVRVLDQRGAVEACDRSGSFMGYDMACNFFPREL